MDEKIAQNWAGAIHLSALIGYVIPFGSLIAPLVLWLMKRNESGFVDEHGKEAVNFHISTYLYGAVLLVFFFVFAIGGASMATQNHNLGLLNTQVWMFGAMAMGSIAIMIALLVWVIMAGIKAFNGEYFRYPLTIRFIR